MGKMKRNGYSYFNYTSAAKSVNYLVPHWLERLLEDCEEEETDEYWSIKLLEGSARACVWSVCALLGAARDGVAASACRLCERHLSTKLRQHIAQLRSDAQLSARSWEIYKQNLADKMPLLMASCVQLAAKMSCSAVELTASKVQTQLVRHGLHYTLDDVIAAEFDVFHTLRFRVPLWTSVECAELLAQEVGLPPAGRAVAAAVEYAEFRRDNIERRARWAADTCRDIHQSIGLSLRTLHLCAGAVSAAMRLSRLDPDPVPRLAQLIRAPPLLVRCLSDVILTLILEEASETSDSD